MVGWELCSCRYEKSVGVQKGKESILFKCAEWIDLSEGVEFEELNDLKQHNSAVILDRNTLCLVVEIVSAYTKNGSFEHDEAVISLKKESKEQHREVSSRFYESSMRMN